MDVPSHYQPPKLQVLPQINPNFIVIGYNLSFLLWFLSLQHRKGRDTENKICRSKGLVLLWWVSRCRFLWSHQQQMQSGKQRLL